MYISGNFCLNYCSCFLCICDTGKGVGAQAQCEVERTYILARIENGKYGGIGSSFAKYR